MDPEIKLKDPEIRLADPEIEEVDPEINNKDPGIRGKTESVDHSILQLLEDPASKEVQQLDLEWF